METTALDRIPTENTVVLPGSAKTEILDVEKTPLSFLAYSGMLSAAASFVMGGIPVVFLVESINIPTTVGLATIGGFVALGTIKGTTILSRLFQRNELCVVLDRKYGDGTSQHYKTNLFRHTLKTKETILPIQHGQTDKNKAQLVQMKLITDWKGIRVETTMQDNPLTAWDENASMVKKVYGCKSSKPYNHSTQKES